MNNNNKAETTQKSQAAKKTKTSTGKVKTIEQSRKRREAREKQYRIFRINSLIRRAKRIGYDKDEIDNLVKLLEEQMNAPKKYAIQVIFNHRMNNKEKKFSSTLAKEAILNAKIECKLITSDFAYIVGDDKVLAKLREILPSLATIYPHPLKTPSVLSTAEPPKQKKPSNNNKNVAHAAKIVRKSKIKEKFLNRKKNRGKATAKQARKTSLLELKRRRRAKSVQLVHKKPSKSLKKAA